MQKFNNQAVTKIFIYLIYVFLINPKKLQSPSLYFFSKQNLPFHYCNSYLYPPPHIHLHYISLDIISTSSLARVRALLNFDFLPETLAVKHKSLPHTTCRASCLVPHPDFDGCQTFKNYFHNFFTFS